MIKTAPDGVEITLHIQPRASRTEVVGLHGDALKIRLAAPPVDGEANDELVRFLAKTLKVPKSAVTIVSGATGRKKRVRVAGVRQADASQLLLPHPPTPSPSRERGNRSDQLPLSRKGEGAGG